MALPRPPPLPPQPPPIPVSSWSRPQPANIKAIAQNTTPSTLPNNTPTPTVKASPVESCSWDQDQAFAQHQQPPHPLAAYQHVPSSQHQPATPASRQAIARTSLAIQRSAPQPPTPQSQSHPPRTSNARNITPAVPNHVAQRVHHISLTSQPIPSGSQATLHHHVGQPQHYPPQSHLYQTHQIHQQLHHQQLAQRQLQQQRQQLHRQEQQHLRQQQSGQRLALHQQSQPLRLQPAPPQHVQNAARQNHLQQGLYRQHPDVPEMHSGVNASPSIQPGVLQSVPGTDVLSVAEASQIGMSFATSAPAGQLDPYQQLPAGGSREYPNADFWHTVIDHNKQQQVAAAAAAAAAAASSNAHRPTGTTSQLFPVNASAAQVLPTRPLSNQPRPSQIAEPRIQKPMLTCDVCGRTFGQRGSLGRHKKAVHMGVRPFPCETCGFCFQQRYDLRKHILSVHEHERPFACEMKDCKAAFSRRAKLRKHVTTVHLKQRDFVCEVCQSAFGEKSNMTKHIRAVHLQERKYQCSICRAAFKERGHCTKHMLTQHNVQPGRHGTAAVSQTPRS